MRIVKTKYLVEATTFNGLRELREVENLGEVSWEPLTVKSTEVTEGAKIASIETAESAEAALIRSTSRSIAERNNRAERIKLSSLKDGETGEIILESLQ